MVYICFEYRQEHHPTIRYFVPFRSPRASSVEYSFMTSLFLERERERALEGALDNLDDPRYPENFFL